MAELLSNLSIASFIVAAVSLAVAAFLFFFFRIPKVMSDLSGRTARRSIARIRTGNEATGTLFVNPAELAAQKGKKTKTRALVASDSGQNKPETLRLSDLSSDAGDSTQVLSGGSRAGSFDDDETKLLNGSSQSGSAKTKPQGVEITTVETVIVTHTAERIL